MAYSRGSSGRSPSVALVTRIPHSHLGEMVEVDEEVEVDPRESSGRATIRHGVTAAAVSKAVTVKYSASIPGGRPAPASGRAMRALPVCSSRVIGPGHHPHGVTAAAARATTVAANAINGDAVSKAVTVKYSASIPGGRPAPASPG
jgi:hypothetical protein